MISNTNTFEDFEPRRPDGSSLYCSIDASWTDKYTGGSKETKESQSGGKETTDEEKLKTKTGQTVARWQDQCFLVDGWKFFKKKNQKTLYRNIIPVEAHSAKVVSTLASIPEAGTFFRLTPAQLSLLVPTIRFYVIDYDPQQRVQRNKEIIFEDTTTEGNIASILKSRKGRHSGAGLKNFSYTFEGGDLYTADKIIRAQSNMIFTAMDVITAREPGGTSFLDLIERRPLKRGKRKIKVVLGWAVPSHHADEFLSTSFFGNESYKDFKGLLRKMQLQMSLELEHYKLDFHEDGRIGLTINWWAAFEGEMHSTPEANLFFSIQDKIKEIKEKSERDISLNNQGVSSILNDRGFAQAADADVIYGAGNVVGLPRAGWVKAGAGAAEKGIFDTAVDWIAESNDIAYEWGAGIQNSTTNDGKDYSNAKEGQKQEREQIARRANLQIEGLKFRQYQSFLQRLIDDDLVRWVDIPIDKKRLWQGSLSDEKTRETTRQDWAKTRPAGTKRLRAGSILGNLSKASFGKGAAATSLDNVTNIKGKVTDQKKKSEKAAEKGSSDALTPKDKYRIYYIYYGDLIDTAMTVFHGNMASTNKKSLIRMMVANMSFVDPGDRTRQEVNMCDLPIALDEFVVWYKNKVIRKNLQSYSVYQFIKDSLNDLFGKAFGESCFHGVGGSKTLFGLENVQLSLSEKGNEPIKKLAKFKYERIISASRLKELMDKYKRPSRGSTSHINYLVLHASTISTKLMKPQDSKADENLGIYHLGIGKDRGIVRDIKFKANKIQGGGEAQIIGQGVQGLEQLFFHYSSTVTLWGCPLFKNGQYVYLDARSMGVSAAAANTLGIGGYHIITRVNGNLSDDGYFVTLDTYWESRGDITTITNTDTSREVSAGNVAGAGENISKETAVAAATEQTRGTLGSTLSKLAGL